MKYERWLYQLRMNVLYEHDGILALPIILAVIGLFLLIKNSKNQHYDAAVVWGSVVFGSLGAAIALYCAQAVLAMTAFAAGLVLAGWANGGRA